MTRPPVIALQLLFGWLNLALAVPSIYLMFGLPLVMRQYGWSGTEIGLFQLAGLPAVFKFLMAVPVQRVRLGRSPLPRWLALLGGVLIVLYALIARDNLIEQRLALFAMTFAISIVATWMDIPLNALAVQWLPRHEQVRAGSIRAAALFVGAIVGGGAMLLVQSRLGWQAPFVIMGAALALGVLALLLVARRLPSVPTPAAMAPGLVADWAGFFGQPAARQWTWLLLSAFPFIGAAWLYLKPLLLDQGMALEQVAWLVGIAGGTLGAFASLVGGRLIPLLGTARAIVLYLLAALLALGVLGLAVWLRLGQPWLIAGALLLALAMGAVSALMFGLTLFFSRQQRSASDYGLQSSLFVVTRLAAPLLAGLLLDRLGYGGLLASLGAGLALALVLAWRVRHSIARSTDALLRTPGDAAPGTASITLEGKP
ncbi:MULTISPECIES: MFS transporter [Pseudomonas]|jgi:predicted MFS family arabinose efflux permease|uniref:PdtE n=1 Tax=Pseudomonas putida TaxID=303 RepID=Q2M5P1_PSEPU|nr:MULTISPECIES: MFS transporter [Pseudomonas]ABC68353.1 PdtE [Pseudomonas putida]MBA6121837.1 MFS transporter [Pseudomonas juntendi]MBI6913806.1 MFS transporter [Pseudomonas juntendi]MCF3157571.1 MFS transporter [Pseudomonas juntendi]MCQ1992669.1 MFS transporter [Pseudomonas sp. Eb3]